MSARIGYCCCGRNPDEPHDCERDVLPPHPGPALEIAPSVHSCVCLNCGGWLEFVSDITAPDASWADCGQHPSKGGCGKCDACRAALDISDVMADPPVRPGTTAHTFKAQRDEARADAERLRDHLAAYSQQAIDAEAEVERLRGTLEGIKARCDRIVAGEFGWLQAATEIANEARRALASNFDA